VPPRDEQGAAGRPGRDDIGESPLCAGGQAVALGDGDSRYYEGQAAPAPAE
jgi:hypothetical protein